MNDNPVIVSYGKIKLDGPLEGFTVPSSFKVPTRELAEKAVETLKSYTMEHPGIEAVTGYRFAVVFAEIL